MLMYTRKQLTAIVERTLVSLNYKREPEGIYLPVEYILGQGGKRIRPVLCLTAYTLFRDDLGSEVVYPAAALEMFHEFTLVHDDIMDNADTRRNSPTVHKKWGTNCAILSGDVMQILAYRYMSRCADSVRGAVLGLFTETAIQVCEGQQLDMEFEEHPFITRDDYIRMIGLKTAVLIACSLKTGAIMAGAPAAVCDALYDYGYQLGLAFQITDDYLDTFGNERIFGKKIGGDIMNNKKSWLLVECLRAASERGAGARLSSILSLGPDSAAEKISSMQALYEELGVKASAEAEILKYRGRALDALKGINLTQDQLACLEEVADHLIHREK